MRRAAEQGFEAALSTQADIAYEQNLASLATAYVMLGGVSSTLDNLRPPASKRLRAPSRVNNRKEMSVDSPLAVMRVYAYIARAIVDANAPRLAA